MNNNSLERPAAISAAAGSGTAAIIVFAMMPILVGGMADTFGLDNLEAGLVATIYFSTYALVALTSPFWVRRVNWRVMTALGFAIMIVSLAFALTATDYTVARISVAASGLGAGMLYPVSLTLVSDMDHTERVYAIKLAVEQLVPAGLLLLISAGAFVFIAEGLSGSLAAILLTVIICLVVSVAMPPAGNEEAAAQPFGSEGMLAGVVALAALALNFAGFAGLWVFMERIAVEQGFDSQFINLWLAVGLITSGVGPMVAAVLSDKLGRIRPLLFSTATALASMTLLGGEISKMSYALALILLPLTYYFGLSYVFSVVATADTNGCFSGLMSFALAVGSAAGPALFGAAKHADGPVLWLMAACIAGGALLVIIVASRQPRAAAVSPL